MPQQRISNEQKAQVWQAYWQRQPARVPVRWSTNPRIIVANPQLNTDGITYEQAATDPQAHVRLALQHQLYLRTVLNHSCDSPTGLPEVWEIGLSLYNVCEAATLGATVHYLPGQVPCTEPFLADSNKHSIFEQDIEHPLEIPFIRHYLAFWRDMERICQDLRFEGRPVRLSPWALTFTDGPVTVGCNLRGTEFLLDLVDDPEYAQRLMSFLIDAAIHRRQAFWDYWGDRAWRGNGLADDSVALISTQTLEQQLLPLYRRYYEAGDRAAGKPLARGIHLCGDATRHFALLQRELGVSSFDTGFPVHHGALRKELGPDVEISGGPEITLLLTGTPDQVYQRTRDILLSGIKTGGRFILQEGNNLPPCCPRENLQAMYTAALEFGHHPPQQK